MKDVDEENAVVEEPGFDSCDEGAGGEAFDSFESVSQAAVLDGVNDADRFAMGRVVIGLRDEEPHDEARDRIGGGDGYDEDQAGTIQPDQQPDAPNGDRGNVNQREQQAEAHTPRRSLRLRARVQTPSSSDSAPYEHSIRTPNGRHFDPDALDRWSDWSRNGRYCNGLSPYRSD